MGSTGCPFSAAQTERDTVQVPEAKAERPMVAPGQQVGGVDRKLETGWPQEVRAGQERAEGDSITWEQRSEVRVRTSGLQGTAGACARVHTHVAPGGQLVSVSPAARGKQGCERLATGHSWQNESRFKTLRGWGLAPPASHAWHTLAAL